MNTSKIESYEKRLFERFPELSPTAENFHTAYFTLKNCFFKCGTAFLCGNGGSNSDSDHIVGELSKGFLKKRPPASSLINKMSEKCGEDISGITSRLQMGFRAMNLNSQSGLDTAFLNDVDPMLICAQQLFVMGREGDVVIGISTSGNAKNVLNTFKVAGGMGIKRILLTGEDGGLCKKYADVVIKAPSKETYRIQEYHLPIYHTLCMMLEETFYGE